MKAPKFPTKKEFESWWSTRTDDPEQPWWNRHTIILLRCQSCPIARYLREHGFPSAQVYTEYWIEDNPLKHIPLPKWATKFIINADNKYGYGLL